MIKSFIEFINEGYDENKQFINSTALKLLNKIRSSDKEESQDYSVFSGMEFTEPFEFDLKLELRRDSKFNAESDSHFKSLPWENINYAEDGYAIDANTRANSGDLAIPEIVITLVLNPDKEPHSYTELHARLIDIVTHETNHLDQIGTQRDPFSANPSTKEERGDAKKSFKYFLLDDEIESMVEGMYARAQHKDIPLDYVFDDYLLPFIKSKYITPAEYEEVRSTWVKYALERYPDAVFSNKVDKIINSI